MVPTFTLCLLGSSALLLCTTPGAQAARCPFPRVQYSTVSPHRHRYRTWDRVTFTCSPGYTLQGSRSSTCTPGPRWNPALPECTKEVTCPRPPNIANGLHSGQSSPGFSPGVTVSYSCREGFELLGNASIACTGSGHWSRPLPRCAAIGCQAPEVQNGRVHAPQSAYRAGDTLHFDCDAGHATEGTDEARCQPGGTWDPPELLCHRVRPCPMPPKVTNGNHNGQDIASFTMGMSVRYSCNPGYYLVGSATVFCRASGNWSQPHPRCEEVTCPRPPNIANGLHSGQSSPRFSPGVTVSYSCREGFELLGNASIACTGSGHWSRPLPRCAAIGCQAPEVQNGRVHAPQSAYRAGDTLHFDCDAGHATEGTDEARCQPGGTWDPPELLCHRVRPCPMPPKVANGNHNSQDTASFTMGMSVRYSCNPGYYLVGSATVSCRAFGNWSQPHPRCEGTVCINPDVANARRVGGHGLLSAPGQTVTFVCHDGYSLQGSASVSCQQDGSWQPPAPVCDRALPHHNSFSTSPGACGAPTRLQFAELNEEHRNAIDFSVGKTVQYTCRPGYAQVPGMSPTIACLESGVWSEALEFCKRKQCSHPGEPVNGRIISLTDLQVGSTVVYSCEEGHRLIGQSSRRCEISGGRVAWSGDIPFCQRIPCEPPPDIPNAKHSGRLLSEFHYGTSVTYSCQPGFPLHGEPSIHCTTRDGTHGVWSEPLPACGVASCPVPQIQNGRIVAPRSAYTHRDTVTFECDPGYAIRGHREIRCQPNNTWEPPVPVCQQEVRCPTPPSIANGQHSAHPGARLGPGSAVLYSCAQGYSLLGDASVHCSAQGTWSRPPRCRAIGCTRPEIENGKVSGLETTYNLEDTVLFECNIGYALKGSQESQCQFGGKWHPPVPTCERLPLCPSPPIIRNGQHNSKAVTEFTPGMSVKYSCDPGYVLTGITTVSCLPSGLWSTPYPWCKAVTCSSPRVKDGAVAEGRRAVYHPGDNVTFQCHPGFVLRGSRGAQCQPDGRWGPVVPTCQPVLPCPPPPVIAHATLSAQPGTNFTSGTSVSYSCQPGFTLLGSPSVLCTAWGNWSLPYPRCAAGCGTPTPLLFAELSEEYENQTEFPIGMTVNYTCRPGYVEQPQISPTITCLENLTWSKAQEFCKTLQCPSPPNIDKGSHDSQDLEVFPPGMVVNYSCDPGYSLLGEASIYCTDAGNWSLPLPQCAGGCGAPPNLTFAELTGEYKNQLEFAVGDTVHYSCRPGHSRRPGVPQTLTCLQNHTWSEALEFCKRKQCEHPEQPRNGRVVVLTDRGFGSTVSHTCDKGYRLVGQSHRRCEILGQDVAWTGLPPSCQRVLCPAPQLPNGRVAVPKPRYTYGHSVTFKCHGGFTLRGQPRSQCQGDGRWHPPVPVCEQDGVAERYHHPDTTREPALHCSKPADITHGSFRGPAKAVFTPGTSVNYICEPGFSLLGTASIYCTASGAWSHPPPVCQAVKCPQPPSITHGRSKGNSSGTFPPGAAVSYSCEPGYSLLGNALIQCTASGSWSQPLPQCKEIRCEFPDVAGVKKDIKGNTYRSGTNITLECDDGYTLEGTGHTQCQEDFSWDPPVPACKLTSPRPGSVGLGAAAAALLLLLGAGVVWKIISKQKEGYYYTYENDNYRTPLNSAAEHKGPCLP